MARLRLFAQAREAAGVASLEIEASTVGALLAVARDELGAAFGAVLDTSRVWVNGDEPASGDDTALASDDEVAVLPPVSGG